MGGGICSRSVMSAAVCLLPLAAVNHHRVAINYSTDPVFLLFWGVTITTVLTSFIVCHV